MSAAPTAVDRVNPLWQTNFVVTGKRRHHHVWKRYLDAWARGQKIACRHLGRTFLASTRDVAVKKDFYRVREIRPVDLQVIEGISKKATPRVQERHRLFIRDFVEVSRLRSACEALGVADSRAEEELLKLERNFEENTHEFIENAAAEQLEELRRGETGFFDRPDKFVPFMHFIALQHMRTKRFVDRMLGSQVESEGFSTDRCLGPLRHILAINIHHYLVESRSQHRFRLLTAPPEHEFITTDQPVINPASYGDVVEVEHAGFFYPVSPTRALLIQCAQGSGEVEMEHVSPLQVATYNHMMASMAHEQVFATSESRLEGLLGAGGLT